MVIVKDIPEEPLKFIKNCIEQRYIYWTYHVNMRLRERYISREQILEDVNTYEIIESYPEDKYLPSYLICGESKQGIFHVQFAVDLENKNVRVITAYIPEPGKWKSGLKIRRNQK